MRRDRRLTEAYENARVEHFDDSSRYVFISDCHRGNGSLSDEFTRNENAYLHALEYYFDHGFTHVEVGDGDELWEYPDFRIIRRAHADVFDALKRFFDAGRFILIWGNHNNYLRNQSYVEKYLYSLHRRHGHQEHDLLNGIEPCEALCLRHTSTGHEFLALHGHQGDFFNDQAWFLGMFGVRYFWRHLHAFGARNPTSPAANAHYAEESELNYHAWVERHRTPLICGHTHLYSFPRHGESPYFNSGCCVYPAELTAIELADGEIQLVRWHVEANDEGLLHVVREVMRGPAPISRFAMR